MANISLNVGATSVNASLMTPTNIKDGSVTTDKLADGAVTTVKLADGSVTDEKLNDAVRGQISDLKSAFDSFAKNGKLLIQPEWEIGGLGYQGKYDNNSTSRSVDLTLFPAGTYTVDSGEYLSYVSQYETADYTGGGLIWWGQSGKNTFTLREPKYIGFMVNTTTVTVSTISIYTDARQEVLIDASNKYRLLMDAVTNDMNNNLLDNTLCQENSGIDSSGKSVLNNASWCSNYFDVNGHQYVCSDKTIYKIAFYDSSKTFQSASYPDAKCVPIPNTAVYARCVFQHTVADFTDAIIQTNTVDDLSYLSVIDANYLDFQNLHIKQESITDGKEVFFEKKLTWEQGVTAGDDGRDYAYNYGIRTNYFAGCDLIISVNEGYRIKIYQYTHKKVGVWQIVTWANGKNIYGARLPKGYLYRLVFARTAETSPLTPSDLNDCGKVYECNYPDTMANSGIEEKSLQGLVGAAGTASSMTFIGDLLYVFRYTSAIDVGTVVNGDTYDVTQGGFITRRNPNSFTFNMGHANTVDYSEGNDCLIVGNGAGYDSQLPNKIYIWKNAKSKTAFLVTDNDCLTIDVSSGDWGKQLNCVWGEDNNRQYNLIYCLTNYEEGNMNDYAVGNPNNFTGESKSFIRRVLLGKGQNNLGSGVFDSTVSDNEFNGTYKVLDVIERPFNSNEYCNDCDYYGNAIYETLSGHFDGVPCSIHEFDSFGKSVNTKRILYPMYDANGNAISTEPQGMAIKDGIRYCFYNGNIMSFKV